MFVDLPPSHTDFSHVHTETHTHYVRALNTPLHSYLRAWKMYFLIYCVGSGGLFEKSWSHTVFSYPCTSASVRRSYSGNTLYEALIYNVLFIHTYLHCVHYYVLLLQPWRNYRYGYTALKGMLWMVLSVIILSLVIVVLGCLISRRFWGLCHCTVTICCLLQVKAVVAFWEIHLFALLLRDEKIYHSQNTKLQAAGSVVSLV